MLTLVMLAAATTFLGATNSGVRVLIEPASLKLVGKARVATIRLGSPRSIAGRIVETRQIEHIDCAGRRWGLVSFEAFDENGEVIASQKASSVPPKMLPVMPDSLGEMVLENVCRLPIPKSL